MGSISGRPSSSTRTLTRAIPRWNNSGLGALIRISSANTCSRRSSQSSCMLVMMVGFLLDPAVASGSFLRLVALVERADGEHPKTPTLPGFRLFQVERLGVARDVGVDVERRPLAELLGDDGWTGRRIPRRWCRRQSSEPLESFARADRG